MVVVVSTLTSFSMAARNFDHTGAYLFALGPSLDVLHQGLLSHLLDLRAATAVLELGLQRFEESIRIVDARHDPVAHILDWMDDESV